MRRADTEGCVRAYDRNGSGYYVLALAEYDALKDAWMAGAAFFTGHDHFGAEIVLRLGNIAGLMRETPEQRAAVLTEEEAERAERAIRGDG